MCGIDAGIHDADQGRRSFGEHVPCVEGPDLAEVILIGGKGVNISRAAMKAEVPTLAVLPADLDDPFVLELRSAGIASEAVHPAGPMRVNITISEPDGTTTCLWALSTSMVRSAMLRAARRSPLL